LSQLECDRVLDILVDEEDSFGAKTLMQKVDTFGLTPLDRAFTRSQRSDISKVWSAELKASTASRHFTNWEFERLDESRKRIFMGGGDALTERWNAYQSAIDDAGGNGFDIPETEQLGGDILPAESVNEASARVAALLARAEFMERTNRISSADASSAYASIYSARDLLLMYQGDGVLTDLERDDIESGLQGAAGTSLEAILTEIRTADVNPTDSDIRRVDRPWAADVWRSDLQLKVYEKGTLDGEQTWVFTPGEARRMSESLEDFLRGFVQRGPSSSEVAGAWARFNEVSEAAATQLVVPVDVSQHTGSDVVTAQQLKILKAEIALLQARLDDHRMYTPGIRPDQLLQAQQSIDTAEYFLDAYLTRDLLSSELQHVVSALELDLPDFMDISRI